jgi:hypothetical protein
MPRPSTPDVQNPNGSTTVTMKRACNGCGERLGDVTEAEMHAGMNGIPLPDVRPECPNCRAEHPVAACRPMRILAGPAECLNEECEEYSTDEGDDSGIDSCSHVREELCCAEHSMIREDDVDPAEPWPCQYDTSRKENADA